MFCLLYPSDGRGAPWRAIPGVLPESSSVPADAWGVWSVLSSRSSPGESCPRGRVLAMLRPAESTTSTLRLVATDMTEIMENLDTRELAFGDGEEAEIDNSDCGHTGEHVCGRPYWAPNRPFLASRITAFAGCKQLLCLVNTPSKHTSCITPLMAAVYSFHYSCAWHSSHK